MGKINIWRPFLFVLCKVFAKKMIHYIWKDKISIQLDLQDLCSIFFTHSAGKKCRGVKKDFTPSFPTGTQPNSKEVRPLIIEVSVLPDFVLF